MPALTETLGITHPIVLAPMAGTATPELAAAVSNAGGLGSLGLAGKAPDAARDMIRAYRRLAAGPLNVNLFCHREPRRDARIEADWIAQLAPRFAELGATPPTELRPSYASFVGDAAMLRMLLAERPEVVSFHFGLPDPDTVDRLRAAGAFLLATATSVREADQIIAAGLDGIVAQGSEAGGHRGTFDPDRPDELLPTAELVQLLRPRTELPLIAAGGIMDGAGIRAVRARGADAVQLGTAFILCPESAATDAHRAAFAAADAPTRLTPVFSGRPARGLVNRFVRIAEAVDRTVPDFPVAYSANKALAAAAEAARVTGIAPYWAGEGYRDAVAEPAARVMRRLLATP